MPVLVEREGVSQAAPRSPSQCNAPPHVELCDVSPPPCPSDEEEWEVAKRYSACSRQGNTMFERGMFGMLMLRTPPLQRRNREALSQAAT